MATPWSPPAWMKTNHSLVGGRFRDDPRVHRACARYFARFLHAYQRAGPRTQILGYDHNWSLHPNDVGPPSDPANPEYARSLLSNAGAQRFLAGTACTATAATRRCSPRCTTRSNRRTSTSASARARNRPTRRPRFPDTVPWHTVNLTVGAVRTWAETVIHVEPRPVPPTARSS
jgi:glucosylceramidase